MRSSSGVFGQGLDLGQEELAEEGLDHAGDGDGEEHAEEAEELAEDEQGEDEGQGAEADGFAQDRTRSAMLDFPGWSQLVRVREGDENVVVLVKPELDGTIPAMLVLVDDGDEIVMVRLKGKLHKFMRANLDEILESAADVGETVSDVGEAVADIG